MIFAVQLYTEKPCQSIKTEHIPSIQSLKCSPQGGTVEFPLLRQSSTTETILFPNANTVINWLQWTWEGRLNKTGMNTLTPVIQRRASCVNVLFINWCTCLCLYFLVRPRSCLSRTIKFYSILFYVLALLSSSEAQAHRQRDLRTLEFLFKINYFLIHYVYNHVKHYVVFYRFLCMGSFSDVLCITVI